MAVIEAPRAIDFATSKLEVIPPDAIRTGGSFKDVASASAIGVEIPQLLKKDMADCGEHFQF